MDEDALRAAIRRLSFASPGLARAFARGDFRSVFRGRGIEFDSLREYYPDDDSRLVDWSAAARLGRPFVRTYREERSLTVFLIVDVSGSMDQGIGERSKLDAAVLVASLAAYAAQLRGLPVGCLLFAGTVLKRLPPRRGKVHALAVAAAAATFAKRGRPRPEPSAPRPQAATALGPQPTALGAALKTVAQVQKRRSLVLVVSDFRAEGWERPLAELARRHDAVAIRISDASDLEPPAAGSFYAADPETGETAWLPLGSRKFRERWKAAGMARRRECREACARSRASLLEIDTADDPARRLLDFFERRRRP